MSGWAGRLIKDHVEQAMNQGYDYDAKFEDRGDGAWLLSVRDLDTDKVDRFHVEIRECVRPDSPDAA